MKSCSNTILGPKDRAAPNRVLSDAEASALRAMDKMPTPRLRAVCYAWWTITRASM